MKILVVDDDTVLLELTRMYLASIGFEDVTLVQSGAQALEAAQAADPVFECILLDVQMPCLTGIETLAALHALPRYKQAVVVMLTAMTDRQHVAQAFIAGAWDYIPKPFDPFDLEARMYGARARVAALAKAERPADVFEVPKVKDTSELRDFGVIDPERFQTCLQRLAVSAPEAISLTVIEIENLSGIAAALGPDQTDRYLADFIAALSVPLAAAKAILAYQGHGVLLALSFVDAHTNPDLIPSAIVRGQQEADGRHLAASGLRAQVRMGQVHYRDLPGGADPFEMLVEAAQVMRPLTHQKPLSLQ